MLALFATAFGLGLLFNAAPGAVFAETIRLGAAGGYRPALLVQIGSLIGDALWAVLGLVGVGLLFRLAVLRVPVGVAGALYLFWLAWDSWRAADSAGQAPASLNEVVSPFRSGMLLSVTNPQNVAYWAALGTAMGAVGVTNPSTADYAIFFSGFMASSIAWGFFCAAAVAWLFRSANGAWIKATYRLCAAAFAGLALASLHEWLLET